MAAGFDQFLIGAADDALRPFVCVRFSALLRENADEPDSGLPCSFRACPAGL
jgi:hypothetical protein